MGTVKIPISAGDLAYNMVSELEGSLYRFRFRFNRRGGAWYMDLGDQETYFILGVKVVTGDGLLDQYGHIEGLPPGTFRVRDLQGLNADPTETDFGDRVIMLYDEAA